MSISSAADTHLATDLTCYYIICPRTFRRISKHPKIPGCLMCISKFPEIPGRLDVRVNVLVFQDVYTYFLGCLDVKSKLVLMFINIVFVMMMTMMMMVMMTTLLSFMV